MNDFYESGLPLRGRPSPEDTDDIIIDLTAGPGSGPVWSGGEDSFNQALGMATDNDAPEALPTQPRTPHRSLFSRRSDNEDIGRLLFTVQGLLSEAGEEAAADPAPVPVVEEMSFVAPRRTSRMRNWIQRKSVQTTTAISRTFEKAREHPVAAVAIITGGLAVTAYASYRFGVSKGGNGSSNQIADIITPGGGPSSTNPVDKATEWYELYRQNNPGATRGQFNQIVLSDEFAAMCKNPEQFARFLAAGS